MFIKKKKYDELLDKIEQKEKKIEALESIVDANKKPNREICKTCKHGIIHYYNSPFWDGYEFCGCDLYVSCENYERGKRKQNG